MTPNTETKYKVQSLERGLAILRELRAVNAPVRNQDLVRRTGLPKATVSRLLNTLGALGYVRRIDQGSYVLAHASARSGRAMLGSLELQRYRPFFIAAPGPVYLAAMAGDSLVPVYRWSEPATGPLSAGCGVRMPSRDATPGAVGNAWDADAGAWWAWLAFRLDGLGKLELAVHVAQDHPPTPAQLEDASCMLRTAVNAIVLGSPQ